MDRYDLVKTLHIISMTVWMAGMFYLPRLFVYHAGVAANSPESTMLKVMERRLLKAIMTPAMISTFIFGIWLAIMTDALAPGGQHWLHAKLMLVLCLAGLHGFFSATVRRFACGENQRTPRFYKILNESVTVIFIGIVILVVCKPF